MAANVTIRAQQRWEYFEVTRSSASFLIHDMNERGQEGWEAISIDHGKNPKGEMVWTAFLKRPCGKQDVGPLQSTTQQHFLNSALSRTNIASPRPTSGYSNG